MSVVNVTIANSGGASYNSFVFVKKNAEFRNKRQWILN